MRYLKLILLPLLCPFFTIAQKLPSVQKESLRAPANIKIDGKATEWSDKFQAYNNGPELYYTISNDDRSLYLVIQAKENLVVRKILAGGITLTVNSAENQKAKITYPVFDQNDGSYINLRFVFEILKKTGRSDSLMLLNNKKLDIKAKEIRTWGIKGIDTLISVYNTYGIKASSRFDDKLVYTYELAIPLKYLGLSIDGDAKFEYNIALNGSDHAEGTVIENIEGGVRTRGATPFKDMQFFWAPTDFNGTYTLAKK